MKQVGEILAQMVNEGRVGQTWLSKKDYKKKFARKKN